ncbi:kinase-like domain-containing protein [Rhizophagus clarus]|uniref:Kinase-like domain-containing protein n=1 Tax=Rhizophagus clarus TaxID=94130 RepID=A0A8H3L6K7_9GLOM|nr:kinase-like domain-containing protein [Rhizophagus clarus]
MILILYYRFGRSKNAILDKFISENNLKWIPFNKFKNIECLDERGFNTIYKAIWEYKHENKEVVLKYANNLNENLDKSLNRWKYHINCLDSYEIINLYGFTKNPTTLNYMAVIDYANRGSLRKNLTKIIEYNWKQKLYILYKIISVLNEIHKKGLIHCDFHSGNILIHKDKEDEEDKIYISGLELCQPINYIHNDDDIYSVLPYVAPEILNGELYTQASDIYSFSIIMWEFTSGIHNKSDDLQLSMSIRKGERPEIIKNTPQCYVNLMKKCWNEDPSERPSALEIKNIIESWIFYSDKIDKELLNNIMEFITASSIGHKNL